MTYIYYKIIDPYHNVRRAADALYRKNPNNSKMEYCYLSRLQEHKWQYSDLIWDDDIDIYIFKRISDAEAFAELL